MAVVVATVRRGLLALIAPHDAPYEYALPRRSAECYWDDVAVNIYQAVKQAVQDLVAPQIESINGNISAMKAEIGALRSEMRTEIGALRGEMHTEVGALRGEMHSQMDGLRAQMDGLRAEGQAAQQTLAGDIRRLDDKLTWALDLRERIVAIETRLGPAPRT